MSAEVEGYGLHSEELSWLANTLQRNVVRDAKLLKDLKGDELTSCLKIFADEVAILNRLLTSKIVRVEDRIDLVLIVRHERKILLTSRHKLSEAEFDALRPNVDFIDGFLKRLSRVDWEALGIPDATYDPSWYWRSFRITEAEAIGMFSMRRFMATYPEPYESLGVGSVVTFTTEPEADNPYSKIVVVRITKICPCELKWEENGQSGKMFEGEVTSEPSDKEGGDEAFGFIFPSGHATFEDSNPDSNYTDRFIRAGTIMLEHESRAQPA